jgi:hypothetical protein
MHTTVGRVGILIRARIILLARVVILCIEYSLVVVVHLTYSR